MLKHATNLKNIEKLLSKAKSLVASWQVLGVAAQHGPQLKGKDPRETLSQALTIENLRNLDSYTDPI